MNTFLSHARAVESDLVRFTRDLIRIPSLSSREGAVIERVREEMTALGFDEVTIDPMGNCLGRLGNGSRVVALDGHIDTVDVGDPAQWRHDPFGAELKDGILYGRGTSDMKGGLAASVYGAALLKRQGGLPGDVTLWVTATVQEEDCDGLCWQYIVKEDGLRPDVVVITEPTSLRVYRGQRGRMEIEVSTSGVSCHGSAPERGMNAIYKMAGILRDIEELNERLPPVEPLGKGSVTISHIRSVSPSLCAVADGCTIHLDRRLTLGETEESAVAEIRALPAVRDAGAEVKVLDYAVPSYTGLTYPTRKYFPSWQTPPEADPTRWAQAAHRATFQSEATLGHWTFSTNGVATAGLHGIPTIGFGPGHERFAHAPDEQVEVEHLVRAAAFYAGFVTAFAADSEG